MSELRSERVQSAQRMSGFSLVELMISMALGLLIVGAAIGMFLSFSRTYTASESLSRVQENGRVAFELMARDIREAGGIPCSNFVPVANVLNNRNTLWWNSWGNGVQGFENGTFPGSLAGTDAVMLMSGSTAGAIVTDHNTATATFTLSPLAHGFVANDILMVCDYEQAAIFQMTGPAANPVTDGTVIHAQAGTPGNCTRGLGHEVDCSTAAGLAHGFPDNSPILRLQSQRWFVAANGRGTNSLFRDALRGSGVATPEEVIEGVDNMQLTYLLPSSPSYVPATAVPASRWREVTAVHLVITLAGTQRVGTDNSYINRRLEHTVTLRSRNL